jgi:hypothetical protein
VIPIPLGFVISFFFFFFSFFLSFLFFFFFFSFKILKLVIVAHPIDPCTQEAERQVDL